MPNHLTPIVIGKKYSRLTPIERISNDVKAARWRCRCDCGDIGIYYGYKLANGSTESCGCLQLERNAAAGVRRRTHGHTSKVFRKADHNRSRTYITYQAMMARCHNPNDPSFIDYGARGISVTKPWRDDFAAFLNDMGERPDNTSIDRIDGRFGYFMANCRWASPSLQARNRKPRGYSRYPFMELDIARRKVQSQC